MNALLELCRAAGESAMVTSQCADRIKGEVCAELDRTQHSALRRIRCEYQHGMLQLIGEVNSYYLKQLAQEHARRVDGVTHVINSIHVIDATSPSKKASK